MTTTPLLSTEQTAQLKRLPTATLSATLSKMGIPNTWLEGPVALPGQNAQRVVGTAYTLRFTPIRADLIPGVNTRTAIEEMPAGSIVVCDTGLLGRVGVVGDVLCSRMKYLGANGLVSSGAVRDAAGIRAAGFPVWAKCVAAPLPSDALMLVGVQELIHCAGVTVSPGDVLVCDDDGVVVIPFERIAEVIQQATQTEHFEEWVMKRVGEGAALPGLYPPSDATRQEYHATLQAPHQAT
ncbi:RraA family protein [Pseudomonas putida]|uniref:RraA family protein n=1 Tax=Pseudomonas putida TaxID=303 RepID=UPI002164BA7E|nr:ribonuclease activity regulator RraA [Pseudomonas putida]